MSQTGTLGTHGLEPGRQAIALGAAGLLSIVAFDVLVVGELSYFFDLSFIVLCLGLALLVRSDDFFTVGVLPPLMMVAAFTLLGLAAPETVAHPDDGVVQAVVTGLAHHSGALVAGYVLCLATLAVRHRSVSR